MIETAKITTILIFENKKQVDHSKHRNKKRSEKCFEFSKRHIKEEKRHCSNRFCRISKFIEMKGFVILVKVDEMYNILKSFLGSYYLAKQPYKRFVKTSFK